MLRWRTDTDEIDIGQWLRGQMYPQRADLSPDGRHIVYFGASGGSTRGDVSLGYSWTAVSALPSLEPLAAWVKDDCWGGGGLFIDDRNVWINERSDTPRHEPVDDGPFAFSLDYQGGEDEPVRSARLDRDGWVLRLPVRGRYDMVRHFVTEQPEIREKATPNGERLRLVRWIEGFHWIQQVQLVIPGRDDLALSVPWADIDQGGRIIATRDGCLVSLDPGREAAAWTQIADLNPYTPPVR